jgi:hypothetical protein
MNRCSVTIPGARRARGVALSMAGLLLAPMACAGGSAVVRSSLEYSALYTNPLLTSQAPGLAACNAADFSLDALVSSAGICHTSPSNLVLSRPLVPGELPEYTLRTAASASPPVSSAELPALRVQAGIQRTPRIGHVANADALTSAEAERSVFITWDQNTPVSSLQFDLHVTGAISYVTPTMGTASGTLALGLTAQRAWMVGPGLFAPNQLPLQRSSFGGDLMTFGRLEAGALWSLVGDSAPTGDNSRELTMAMSRQASFDMNAASTGVEQFVPDAGPCRPGAAGCSGSWQPWLVDLTDPPPPPSAGGLGVDTWLRITLGGDFTGTFFGDDPPGGATAAALRGVELRATAVATAHLAQRGYESFADDAWAGTGSIDVDFGNTFQVSDLRLFNGDQDVTVQARGVLAGNYEQASSLSYVGAVPEPGTWALLLGGLALLVARSRRQAVEDKAGCA